MLKSVIAIVLVIMTTHNGKMRDLKLRKKKV